MTSVLSPIRCALLLLAALTLTHCQKNPAPQTQPATEVSGALHGITWTRELLPQNVMSGINRPGAPLGIYITSFLIDATGIHLQSATSGVEQGLGIITADQESLSGSFLILQQLGVVLQADVPDMMNRSDDRQKTLDAYIDSLTQILDRSKAQLTALKQQQSALLKDLHAKRGVVAGIQHDLNTALQKKDYTAASAKQTAIVDAKAQEAAVDAKQNQLQSTINLYTNLNNVGNRRLKAILANRAALIAGVQVIDLPGVNELGVLKKQGVGDSTNTASPFGSTGN